MMSHGYPRKSLICLEDTPYHHVAARCVRRAWLCGYDAYAGKDCSHRKGWVLHRLRYLADVFAPPLVLRLQDGRASAVERRAAEELIERWASD